MKAARRRVMGRRVMGWGVMGRELPGASLVSGVPPCPWLCRTDAGTMTERADPAGGLGREADFCFCGKPCACMGGWEGGLRDG